MAIPKVKHDLSLSIVLVDVINFVKILLFVHLFKKASLRSSGLFRFLPVVFCLFVLCLDLIRRLALSECS